MSAVKLRCVAAAAAVRLSVRGMLMSPIGAAISCRLEDEYRQRNKETPMSASKLPTEFGMSIRPDGLSRRFPSGLPQSECSVTC